MHPEQCRHRIVIAWFLAFLLHFCCIASESPGCGDVENERCPCPTAEQSLGSWLGCIGLSTEQRERIESQGWNAADLRKMLTEEEQDGAVRTGLVARESNWLMMLLMMMVMCITIFAGD